LKEWVIPIAKRRAEVDAFFNREVTAESFEADLDQWANSIGLLSGL
jgi:hypothetical protein